jgi:hypothetical protein
MDTYTNTHKKLLFVYNPENWNDDSIEFLEDSMAFELERVESADVAYGLLESNHENYIGVFLGDLRIRTGCLKNISELEAGLLVTEEARSLGMKTMAMVLRDRGLAKKLRQKGDEIIVMPANIDEYISRLREFFSSEEKQELEQKKQEPNAACVAE